MWKHSFRHNGKLVRFENGTWDGLEHVYVDDFPVSSKFSIMGTSHEFKVGNDDCTLIVKVSPVTMIDVYLSFYANKKLVFKDFHVPARFFGDGIDLDFFGDKYRGLKHLNLYDIDDAIEDFKKALKKSSSDYDSHFYLACCYSLKEEEELGNKHLQIFIDNRPEEVDKVLKEDKLAFLRMSDKVELLKA